MDVIGDVLNLFQFRGCLYFRTDFRAPWSLRVPNYQNVARFHMVVEGRGWFLLDGFEPQELKTGDLIVIPFGAEHILCDHPGTDSVDLEEAMTLSQFSGQGPFTFGGPGKTGQDLKMVCGHFEYHPVFNHPLVDELPPFWLGSTGMGPTMGWFHQALHMLAVESQLERPGNAVIQLKLTEILFIHMIRMIVEKKPSGFFRAFADDHIGQSLKIMHRDFQKKWTVGSLANEVGLSRTAFALRFQQMTGRTPLNYLTHWRLERAKNLLLTTRESIESIGYQVGYESMPAFARLFKKWLGQTPGQFRQTNHTNVSEPIL